MTSVRSRARQWLLSTIGIAVLVLLVGVACVPQELRAAVVTRMAHIAQNLNTALAGAWYSAFALRGPNGATVSTVHPGRGSYSGARSDGMGGGAPSIAPSGVFGDGGTLGAGLFQPGAASNAMAGFLADMLQENNSGSGAGSGIFGTSSSGPATLRTGGSRATGTDVLTGDASLGTPSNSSRKSAIAVPRPAKTSGDTGGMKPDAGVGAGSLFPNGNAGISWQQVASGQSSNQAFGEQSAGSDGSSWTP